MRESWERSQRAEEGAVRRRLTAFVVSATVAGLAAWLLAPPARAATGYFTAPAVRPDWIWRWKTPYTMIIGRMASVRAANSVDHSAW